MKDNKCTGGCGDTAIDIKPPLTCDPQICADPNPCPEITPADCVKFTNEEIPLCGIEDPIPENATLTEMQQAIISMLQNLSANCVALGNDETIELCTEEIPAEATVAQAIEAIIQQIQNNFATCVNLGNEEDITLCEDIIIPANANIEEVLIALIVMSQNLCNSVTELFVQNTVFVDTTYGDDTTGERERLDLPFATLWAARDAAQYGDIIYVRPSVIDIENTSANGLPYNAPFNYNLWKNGVTYYFKSTTINVRNQSDVGDTLNLFKPRGESNESCYVYGELSYHQEGVGEDSSGGLSRFFDPDDFIEEHNRGYTFIAKGKKLTTSHCELVGLRNIGRTNQPVKASWVINFDTIVGEGHVGGNIGAGAAIIMGGSYLDQNLIFDKFEVEHRVGIMIRKGLIDSKINIKGEVLETKGVNTNLILIRLISFTGDQLIPTINIDILNTIYSSNQYFLNEGAIIVENTVTANITVFYKSNFKDSAAGQTPIINNEGASVIQLSGSIVNNFPDERLFFSIDHGIILLKDLSFTAVTLNGSMLGFLTGDSKFIISNSIINWVSALSGEISDHLFHQGGTSKVSINNSTVVSDIGIGISNDSHVSLSPSLNISNSSIQVDYVHTGFKVETVGNTYQVLVRNSYLKFDAPEIFTNEGLKVMISNSTLDILNGMITTKTNASLPGIFYAESSTFKVFNQIHAAIFDNSLAGTFHSVSNNIWSQIVNVDTVTGTVNVEALELFPNEI